MGQDPGAAVGASTSHDIHLAEHIERGDHLEDQTQCGGRFHQWNGYPEEGLEVVGSIYLRGFVYLLGYLLDSRREEDHVESRGPPIGGDSHRPHRLFRIGQPAYRFSTELPYDLVEQSVVALHQPGPKGSHYGHREDIGNEEDIFRYFAEWGIAGDQQCHGETEHHEDRSGDEYEFDRMPKGAEKEFILEQSPIVRPSGEGSRGQDVPIEEADEQAEPEGKDHEHQVDQEEWQREYDSVPRILVSWNCHT